jgi:hypothetical protein
MRRKPLTGGGGNASSTFGVDNLGSFGVAQLTAVGTVAPVASARVFCATFGSCFEVARFFLHWISFHLPLSGGVQGVRDSAHCPDEDLDYRYDTQYP